MRPLIVRLPNWVGDVIMSLPVLWHLHQRGYQLQLVGKRWAATLLGGTPWSVHSLPEGLRARVAQLRGLRHRARIDDPGFNHRLNTLLLTNSFSSALESRLAGLKSVGYRQDGRGWLLRHAHPQPAGVIHESQRFQALGMVLAPMDEQPGAPLPPCPMPWLPISRQASQQAGILLAQHGLTDPRQPEQCRPYVCLVPFATGTLNGASKAWPGFPRLCQQLSRCLPVLILPAPGEETRQARQHYPGAILLENVGLDVYAAILGQARLVLANDTGPGHMAAATGARLLSILGPSDRRRYGPSGPDVSILQQSPWPSDSAVWQATVKALSPLPLPNHPG